MKASKVSVQRKSPDCELDPTDVQQYGSIIAFIDDMILEDLVIQRLRLLDS